jgi:hypothetical protein
VPVISEYADYRPEDDGYLVLIEPGDVDRVLDDLDVPYRLSEVPFEGVNPDMKVLKTATCKTLSGKSTLTYQIGCSPESIIHLHIAKNTGAGFFSDEWVAFPYTAWNCGWRRERRVRRVMRDFNLSPALPESP